MECACTSMYVWFIVGCACVALYDNKTDSSLENIKILGFLGFVTSFEDNMAYCRVL